MLKVKSNNNDEDIILWNSITQGDKKAFEKLFSKYYTNLYSYSRYYVSAQDAEEIVQDLMLWLWDKRKEFTPTTSMQSYLLVSVKNRCLTFLRKENRILCNDEFFLSELDTFYEETDVCIINELEQAIATAISQLPESYRLAFEMSRFENKTRTEIAESLDISVKTVDYRMQQAINILRTELKDYLPLLAVICRFM